MTKVILNTKISEVKNKIPNHDKYITIPEFSKLSAESYAARLMRADLLRKTDFDNKQTSFNEQITSNKAKHLKALKKLSSLITKDYNFSLGRMYFTSNDKSRNMFVYQSTLYTLELKKKIKVKIMFLVWNRRVNLALTWMGGPFIGYFWCPPSPL